MKDSIHLRNQKNFPGGGICNILGNKNKTLLDWSELGECRCGLMCDQRHRGRGLPGVFRNHSVFPEGNGMMTLRVKLRLLYLVFEAMGRRNDVVGLCLKKAVVPTMD